MKTKLKESMLDVFLKEFELKCEKSFLKSTNIFADEDIDYLLNLNPDKNLRYTLNNLTLEQAKKLSDKVFKIEVLRRNDFSEINEMIDDPEGFPATNCFVVSLQLGVVTVELLIDNLTEKVLSEYVYYVKEYCSKTNKYFWDYRDYVGTSINPLKLYKDLVKYFEDNDNVYLSKYLNQMFDIIQNQQCSYLPYWYLSYEGVEDLYDDYIKYLKTDDEQYVIDYYKAMMEYLMSKY
jgi:hypothetical protein